MKYSYRVQLLCIVLVFLISLCGFALPFKLVSRSMVSGESDVLHSVAYAMLKSFSTGVILGVALMHLAVDSVEDLSAFSEYPSKYIHLCCHLVTYFCVTVGLGLVGAGYLLTLGIEQFAMSLSNGAAPLGLLGDNLLVQLDPEMEGKSPDLHKQSDPYRKKQAPPEVTGPETLILGKYKHKSYHEHHDGNIAASNQDKGNKDSLLRAYLLEAAVAVHSIIIGFGFGTLTSAEIGTIRVLTVAFCFHQLFEGISLGALVSDATSSVQIAIKFGLVFACTFPFGAAIGLIIQSSGKETSGGSFITGAANALSAGILLHSSMSEMIPHDFSHAHQHNTTIGGKASRNKSILGMYFSLLLGFGSMALLAFWA
jgi:zinc transporter ZupT